jgi:hypothetical protein
MIDFQLYEAITPAMMLQEQEIPEERYRVRVNFAEILDYVDGTGSIVLYYDGPVTIINYRNGCARYLMVDFDEFHARFMKYKASQTRYIIQTRFN